ncbi:hypothetical protein ACFQS6_02000 [Xanthomonas populi]
MVKTHYMGLRRSVYLLRAPWPTGLAHSPQDSCSVPNLERDKVVDEPMEAPFYLATSCFHKRNRVLRVIFTRMSAEPQEEWGDESGELSPYEIKLKR